MWRLHVEATVTHIEVTSRPFWYPPEKKKRIILVRHKCLIQFDLFEKLKDNFATLESLSLW